MASDEGAVGSLDVAYYVAEAEVLGLMVEYDLTVEPGKGVVLTGRHRAVGSVVAGCGHHTDHGENEASP